MSKLLELVGLSALVLTGCHGKSEDTTPKTSDVDNGVPKVDPTLCDTNGKNVVTADLNHDNRPDVWRLFKVEEDGGTKTEFHTCTQVDFDHDGRKDWVVGYNGRNTKIFEKADLDFDGRWDVSTVFDPKTGVKAEVERDTDFDGKFDVKEVYDSAGQLTSVRRDRNGDGQPDLWEQYKDGILLAILYDDDFDGKVDRREEIPGARPKVEMPTTADPTASGSLESPPPAAGTTKPAQSPAQPVPPAAKKK
jgi:hypothetical protein